MKHLENIQHPTCAVTNNVGRGATQEVSQPRSGWYCKIKDRSPERTKDKATYPTSLQDVDALLESPATSWLANIYRRFATGNIFETAGGPHE
jgi:hypothetical protein